MVTHLQAQEIREQQAAAAGAGGACSAGGAAPSAAAAGAGGEDDRSQQPEAGAAADGDAQMIEAAVTVEAEEGGVKAAPVDCAATAAAGVLTPRQENGLSPPSPIPHSANGLECAGTPKAAATAAERQQQPSEQKQQQQEGEEQQQEGGQHPCQPNEAAAAAAPTSSTASPAGPVSSGSCPQATPSEQQPPPLISVLPGEVVWVQVKGEPVWPALVITTEEADDFRRPRWVGWGGAGSGGGATAKRNLTRHWWTACLSPIIPTSNNSTQPSLTSPTTTFHSQQTQFKHTTGRTRACPWCPSTFSAWVARSTGVSASPWPTWCPLRRPWRRACLRR